MNTPPLYEPVATFEGYDGETGAPIFKVTPELQPGDKLCVCAPAQAAAPTDLSKQLRDITKDAGTGVYLSVRPQMLNAAAEEIERYYGGMMAWKKTAEKKDRDWNEARMALENDCLAGRPAHPAMPAPQQAAPSASVDKKELLRLMCNWHQADPGVESEEAFEAVAEFVAPTMPALLDHAHAEPKAEWVSVRDELPAKYCLAVYETSRGQQRIIRAMHVKQYQIEANGDECDSETNEADDMEYIKAGWYECIDNWGEYSSVKVCEGEVTHWMPLPSLPGAPAGEVSQGAAPTAADVRDSLREFVLPGYSASSGEGGGVRPDPEGEYVLRTEAIEAAASVFAAQPNIQEAGK